MHKIVELFLSILLAAVLSIENVYTGIGNSGILNDNRSVKVQVVL